MSRIEQALKREARELRPGAPTQAILDKLAKSAARRGLVDVAYTQADSPFGPLTLAATEQGLVLLAYPELELDGVGGRHGQRPERRVGLPVGDVDQPLALGAGGELVERALGRPAVTALADGVAQLPVDLVAHRTSSSLSRLSPSWTLRRAASWEQSSVAATSA